MAYITLMRIKHYIKNLFFIFIPCIFSYSFTDPQKFFKTFLAFLAFSLVASVVYIINDIADIEKDRKHPKKKNRPLASGQVSVSSALCLAVLLLILASGMAYFLINLPTLLIIWSYLVMNLAYSFKLKTIPLIDVMILALGFILRVYAGALAIGVEVSEWLLLTTLALSLFLGFGKRYGEKLKSQNGETRGVLQQYTTHELQSFMLITMTLTIVFYSLYTILGNTILHHAVLTVPVVVLGVFRYYMLLEKNAEDGDPTEVIFNDRILQLIVAVFAVLVGILILF